MAEASSHEPGSFCWADLATTDVEAALAFYTGLFGWTSESRGIDGGGEYHTLRGKDGMEISGLFAHDAGMGRAADWLSYVAVANAAETAAKVEGLGGEVVTEARDIADAGRAAVLRGPGGELLALWEARNHPGAELRNRPGAMCWNELITRDADASRAFYTNLLGWDTDLQQRPGYRYTTFLRARLPACGMVEMPEESGEITPRWMVYFGVQDCAAATAKAESLGGTVGLSCTDVPGIGTFAALADPLGAVFSVVKREGW
jgi:predicted enzyme related to lactoylglutathione lyase